MHKAPLRNASRRPKRGGFQEPRESEVECVCVCVCRKTPLSACTIFITSNGWSILTACARAHRLLPPPSCHASGACRAPTPPRRARTPLVVDGMPQEPAAAIA